MSICRKRREKQMPIRGGSESKCKENICHEGTKTLSLMNAKCKVQNAKVKMKGSKIMASGHTAILQFAF